MPGPDGITQDGLNKHLQDQAAKGVKVSTREQSVVHQHSRSEDSGRTKDLGQKDLMQPDNQARIWSKQSGGKVHP